MPGVPPLFNLVLDLVGVVVFAFSGALAAVRKRLDLFGVIVVGTATALGGGLVRDLLIGDTPPATLRDWRYLTAAGLASLLTFSFHRQIQRLRRWMLVLDALGLGLFTVTGTAKALAVPQLQWAGVVLIGVLTAVGGGVLRDVLLREIPLVLRKEIYAVAAVGGSLLLVVGYAVVGDNASAGVWLSLLALVVVSGIRLTALWRRWNAPVPKGVGETDA